MRMRPSFDDVAIRIARTIAERSTCLRLHTAAVICTQDNRIVATGYNGSLPGQPHCDDPIPCDNCRGEGQVWDLHGSHECRKCKGSAVNVGVLRGCDVVDNHCIRTVHAELNAILQAAKYGISLRGCVIYSLHTPCATCANAIVQAGIVKVYVDGPYSIDYSTDRLVAQGIPVCSVSTRDH